MKQHLAMQIATLGAELESYAEASEIFESMARSYVDNNLLKYSAKGLLLNAGLCQLCREPPLHAIPPWAIVQAAACICVTCRSSVHVFAHEALWHVADTAASSY